MSELLRLLSTETGLSVNDLTRVIVTAPRRYKVFEIPKRTGGTREIAQPAREVKLLQRVLTEHYLTNLPVHEAARAYRKGLSIFDNAEPHAGGSPILKMDFKDFFPSIRSTDWESYCDIHNVFEPGDRPRSSLILFRRLKHERLLKLSIGAPSSPALCNILLFDFDELISKEAERRGIRYTRYADDLTFSGQRIGMLKDMIKVVEQSIRTIRRPKLTINSEKTTFITASQRRAVTGIVLANNGLLSLGRDRKRLLSAQVHRASLHKMSPDGVRELAGQLAFANVVEPQFLEKLRTWYGADLIIKIQRSVAGVDTR
jgi:RNA-directed DNA polymerase